MVAVLACVAGIVVDVVYNAVKIFLPSEIFLLSIYLSSPLCMIGPYIPKSLVYTYIRSYLNKSRRCVTMLNV